MKTLNTTSFDTPSGRRAQLARQARQGGLVRLVRWFMERLALGGGTPPLAEADRLAALQRFLAEEFQGCWMRMSARDRQLYRVLIRSTSIGNLQRLRFECFHLMCRLLGEGAARSRQQQIDGWLLPRH